MALIVGVALVGASGAATTKAQKTTKINVSTRAAVVHYLRSIHVNAKHAVIQRGARNYAGARCPGKGWTCASTKHTVVQISKRGGTNRFACKSNKCVVVQLSGVSHGVYSSIRQLAARGGGGSTGTCIKTNGLTQDCTISQAGTGPNVAGVYENAGKSSGLTQSALYTASITQQSSGSNPNTACVTQLVNMDGSTTAQKGKPVTVTLKAHQSVIVKQDVVLSGGVASGINTANQAANSSGACTNTNPAPNDAPGATPALLQSQVLTSTANGAAAITQNENRNDDLSAGDPTPNVTDPTTIKCRPDVTADTSNLCIDVEQNQGNGLGVATGANDAKFWQNNTLGEVANTSGGPVVQIQGAQPVGVGGILGTVNQNSSGLSTFKSTQRETQCEHAVSQPAPLPTPSACAALPGSSSSLPYLLIQNQYGPEGMGSPAAKGHARVPFSHYGKDPNDSSQTGDGDDSFTVDQGSTQNNDSNTLQNNHIIGGLLTDGNGTVTQNVALQNGSQNKQDVQVGSNTTVSSQMDCLGSTAFDCTKTLSAPKITGHPISPVFGTDASTFTFTNADPTVAFSCSLTGTAGSYSPCNGTGTQTYSASSLPSGLHTFYVKTRDADNGDLSDGTDSFTWVITPADPVIDTHPPATDTFGHAEAFTFHDADGTAHFQCQIDSQPVASCNSGSASYSGLASGAHTFSVTAYDQTDTYPSVHATTYPFVITPPDPTISSGPDLQTASTDATFTFADDDSTVLFKCNLDGAGYSACPSGTPTYSDLSHGPHTLVVKAMDQTGTYPSTGVATYSWEVIPYLTFETTDDGAFAGWSGIPGASPITLTTGSAAATYAQFTIHDFDGIAVSGLAEPTFTTDTYSGGAPRYEIDFSDGNYAFGYPAQANDGTTPWELVDCSSSCASQGLMSWGDVQSAEGSATVSDALIEADFPTNATYSITGFTYDGYDMSDFGN